jgi:thiamine pyrophosphate-dependent acetolactate synthase large subunit-like protein
MKVYDRIADAFVAEGVKAVFGLMGSCNAWWMHGMHQRGVKLYDVRYEGDGVFMADGWARASNQVGVASATDGPGTAQMAAALITASRASSPIVAFVGEPPTSDPENSQQLDHARFADACETGFVRLTAPQVADDMVRKAFYLAWTESRPILLSCPIDFQDHNIEFNKPYQPSTMSVAQQPLQPRMNELEAAVESISRSRKPVIVVGRGARWANAGDAVLELAERIGALISTSLMAKTWLAEDEFHAGMSGRAALKTANGLFNECDLVIGVGASLNRYTTEYGTTYPNARYVQVDIKPSNTASITDAWSHSVRRSG